MHQLFHIDEVSDVDLALAGLLELLADFLLALLEDIRATLQEQHPEDVYLEFRGIHFATQDIGRLEQVPFQLV